jgi:hypothetical protein
MRRRSSITLKSNDFSLASRNSRPSGGDRLHWLKFPPGSRDTLRLRDQPASRFRVADFAVSREPGRGASLGFSNPSSVKLSRFGTSCQQSDLESHEGRSEVEAANPASRKTE